MKSKCLLLLIALFFALIPARSVAIVPLSEQSPVQPQTPLLSDSVATISLPLEHWLNLLGQNENCPENGIIDSNGLKSYGRYCFQLDTFNRYSKKYGMVGQITDDTFTRQLVIKIIHEPDGWENWYTTIVVKGIGLPPLTGESL